MNRKPKVMSVALLAGLLLTTGTRLAVADPTATAPTTQTSVVTDTHSENYMLTIAKSTFYGAVAGVLVGSALYFLNDTNASNIAYWGAGGALLGVGVGTVQIIVTERRTDRALSSLEDTRRQDTRPPGKTVGLRLIGVRF